MGRSAAIAIFDIGKTNKKLFLFDESYHIIREEAAQLPEIADEDGFPCEDIGGLRSWMQEAFARAMADRHAEVKALNFSGYGASLVCVDGMGKALPPMYNYLKPFPGDLQQAFYEKYGGLKQFCLCTASPALGSLNSGLQLLRLKKDKPGLIGKVRYAVHLPQWLAGQFSGKFVSELTSIGCHTAMWNFEEKKYHQWLGREGLEDKLAPIFPGDWTFPMQWKEEMLDVGTGLHDSSAALIPYQLSIREPFVLMSTGTWSISLNPFNDLPLTAEELEMDCLCYLNPQGRRVKASRLFAGHLHDLAVARLAAHFQVSADHYKAVTFNPGLLDEGLLRAARDRHSGSVAVIPGILAGGDLDGFRDFQESYHHLVFEIIQAQKKSTDLVMVDGGPGKIFVDGGFSRNPVFMQLLANVYEGVEVYAASVAQASATGAALVIHKKWNGNEVPGNLVASVRYPPSSG